MSKTIDQGKYCITINSSNGDDPLKTAAVLTAVNKLLLDDKIFNIYCAQEAERDFLEKNANDSRWKFGARPFNLRDANYCALSTNASFLRQLEKFNREHPQVSFDEFYSNAVRQMQSSKMVVNEIKLEEIVQEKREPVIEKLRQKGMLHNYQGRAAAIVDSRLNVLELTPKFKQTFGNVISLMYILQGGRWLSRFDILSKENISTKAEDSYGIITQDKIPDNRLVERGFKIECCYEAHKGNFEGALMIFEERSMSYLQKVADFLKQRDFNLAKRIKHRRDIGTYERAYASRFYGAGLGRGVYGATGTSDVRVNLGSLNPGELSREAVECISKVAEMTHKYDIGGIKTKLPNNVFIGEVQTKCLYWPEEKKADTKVKSFLPVPVYAKK
jgi:hypothetical protein